MYRRVDSVRRPDSDLFVRRYDEETSVGKGARWWPVVTRQEGDVETEVVLKYIYLSIGKPRPKKVNVFT